MKKIITRSLIVTGILMASSQSLFANGGPPPAVPDGGLTALLLIGSMAGIALVRRTVGQKK